MNSQNNKENSTARYDPIKYKFIRKVMRIDANDGDSGMMLARYTKMKRIHFKKIIKEPCQEYTTQYYYMEGKRLSRTTGLELFLCRESHDKKLVKYQRNLKNIQISGEYIISMEFLNSFIKSLPKNIETVKILIPEVHTNIAGIPKLYKNLRAFPKLTTFEKNFDLQYKGQQGQEGINLKEIEYNSLNKHLPKLRNLKEVRCTEASDRNQRLQNFMSKGQVSPLVKYLSLNLWQDMLRPGPDEGGRIAPIYRFNLFPNLRQLTIMAHMDNLNIDPSIVEGFKSLLQLKQLTLNISTPDKGTKFIFEALLQLPLLNTANLSIRDIPNEEGLLLLEFLDKQSQLVSLSIRRRGNVSSREESKEYNQLLESICQSLNNKVKLRHLCLSATGWSLESISRGLGQVEMTNQLKEFETDIFDDFSVTSMTPSNRVKGLCDFIKRQKLSLTSLKISMESVNEDEIIDSLIKAINETNELELLEIRINNTFLMFLMNSQYNNKLVEGIVKEPSHRGPSFTKTFHYLTQALEGLRNLSSLRLEIKPLQFDSDIPTVNSSVILNIFPRLKDLRSVSLHLPFMDPSTEGNFLFEMKSLADCQIRACGYGFEWQEIDKIETAISQTRKQRFIRITLRSLVKSY